MPHVEKRPLDTTRIRTVPKEGFSWIDRRFVRDGFIDLLPGPEILLYAFLCMVSDQHGLSFFGDRRTARTLKLGEAAIERARRGLVRSDLIRYRPPIYQVLSLPSLPLSDDLVHLTVKPPAPPGESAMRPLARILEESLL